MGKVKINDFKIQVRIQRNRNGYYYGQVFKPEIVDEKCLLYYMNCELKDGWNDITSMCYTKWGCKVELKRWKKQHFIDAFEI